MVDINFSPNSKKQLIVNNLPLRGTISFEKGLNIIVGSNGLGKSTFFHFLKNHPKEIFGSHSLAFMDQFPLNPLSDLRVKDLFQIMVEDITYFNKQKLNDLIKTFNFGYLLDRSVHALSGGENQILKFMLIGSQCTDYYFFDEPLQYLDGENLEQILFEINLISKKGIVVLIEHRKEHLDKFQANWIMMKKRSDHIEVGVPSGA